MRTVKLKLADTKFAFVQGNRAVDEKRLEKAIREVGQVLIPIYGVFYKDIKDSGIEVFDAQTDKLIDTPTDDYFVVLDGQHRTKVSLNLFKKKQEKQGTPEDPEHAVMNFADTIPATVLDKDDVKCVNPLAMIMNINTSSKSWSSKDFAHSAHMLKKNDEIVSVIYWLMELGFSISNISRILFFDHKALNNQRLADYSNGKGELPECNLNSKLELLSMLRKLGFSVNFLRKRYLYEIIIKKNNAQKHEEFVNALSQLDTDTVKQIEQLTPTDFDNGKISEIVARFVKNNSQNIPSSKFDLSENRLKENLNMLSLMAESVKVRQPKAKKKDGSGNKGKEATKQSCYTNCMLEDVV